MELLLVVAVWSVIVKKAIVDGAVDFAFAVRGKPSPRWGSKSRWRPDGAASRYFSQLWSDSWDDALAKHSERRARRQASTTPDKPRGAATQFLAGLLQDRRRKMRRSWEDGWVRADEKRREKSARPRPGQDTVPGEVVPNVRDEDRPQDETRPGPEPQVVPTQDGTDLRFGDDSTDPTGTKTCPECRGTVLVDGEICLSCLARQEQRNQHHDDQSVPDCPPDFGPDQDTIPPATPTQEGTPTMTATATEVVGLESGITFSETSAQAYNAMVGNIEQTLAALDGFDVGGPARAAAAAAMEQSAAAAQSMLTLAEELKKHRVVAEAIDATAGAGKREFYTAGR